MQQKVQFLETRISDFYRFLTADGKFTLSTNLDMTLPARLGSIWEFCASKKDSALSWMLFAAIAGVFPREEDFREFHGHLIGPQHLNALHNGLVTATRSLFRARRPARRIAFFAHKVVVDVDFTARTDYTTGIQRVTRNLVSEWSTQKDFELVGWNEDAEFLIGLNGVENSRMLGEDFGPVPIHEDSTMIIPFQCEYFLPEVPRIEASKALVPIAVSGLSRVTCVGYDMIPIMSAPRVSHLETEKFAAYLSALKHFDRVMTISGPAALEFRGFNETISAQGIQGPEIIEGHLPISKVDNHNRPLDERGSGVVRVLCVGTIEPRKGQRKVLAACETLWQKGARFEIDFVGHSDPNLSGAFLGDFNKLVARGRPVRHLQGLSDLQLSEKYDACDFTVFVSEHEGFGLPIAESHAHGKPVVCSNFGIMKELATMGTHVLVNPESITSIAAGIEQMIDSLSKFESQFDSLQANVKSWANFADEVWIEIVRK